MNIFKKISDEFYDDAVSMIIDLVNIDSVYDESTVSEDKPYGEGVHKTLVAFKDLAISKGLDAEIVGNRCVEIKVGTKGREVGIFGHLDVVPATGDWSNPPFNAVIKDERIYGRGTSDDKGPLVAAFCAVLGLVKHNLVDNYRIRIVAGGDEERGSSCLEHYFDVEKRPHVDCGFTPDAEFPLIYGEKGIVNYTLTKNIKLNGIIEIDAGVASNCVIDAAKVKAEDFNGFKKFLDKSKCAYHNEDDWFVFEGKSAHGSMPELGKNSGIAMLFALGTYFNSEFLLKIAHQYEDYNGRNIDLFFETKNMGVSTYNVGLISYKNNEFSMTVNFRFPESVIIEDVIEKIKATTDCEVDVGRASPVLYFDPESKMIQTLYNAYVEESGDTVNKPMTIGGGTYAKEAKNIVAFGSNFPGKVDHIHEPDEKIDLEDVKKSIQLYARAIYDLGNM